LVKKKKEKKDLTAEFLKIAPSFLASTGGSLLLFFLLLPFVLGQLVKSLPQLAGLAAGLSKAITDPVGTANDLGKMGADATVAVPVGFFGGLAGAGFGLGQILTQILGGGGPTTPKDDRELTYCERLGNDLVLIKRKLDVSSGLDKIQGTFAYAAKLYDIKKEGCGKPAFIKQDDWDRVPV